LVNFIYVMHYAPVAISVGNIFRSDYQSCKWELFYNIWNSGNNTTATISVVNQNTEPSGNDFALDDILFAPIILQKDSVAINVDTPATLAVPNAFTPNGDGRNDCFRLKLTGNATLEAFSVFNRWGQRAFTSNNITACWDGRINGQPANAGVYTYTIKAQTYCGQLKRNGIVMLIR
jgi:gliding motility-associated-like protein